VDLSVTKRVTGTDTELHRAGTKLHRVVKRINFFIVDKNILLPYQVMAF